MKWGYLPYIAKTSKQFMSSDTRVFADGGRVYRLHPCILFKVLFFPPP